MSHQKRGLYYCQYLVGIGHLVRSLNICRSLVKKFEIDFLLGGYQVDVTLESPHFHILELPPLDLENPSAAGFTEEILKTKIAERQSYIENIKLPYDFFITEIFPFSKWCFKDEIETLILKIKKLNPNCVIACSLRDSSSLRDICSVYSPDLEYRILDFIDKYYDVVFVHSDPRIYKLEESFSIVEKQLKHKLIYTGFIVRPDEKIALNKREKRIVVSLGSGRFGGELLHAVLKVISFFPNYKFVFITGPKTSDVLINEFKELVPSSSKNIQILPFIDHFPEYLSKSALSISLGGYTIMDIVYTKTPALVYPSTFHDQYVRALKFSCFGFLKIITQQDLEPSKLMQMIKMALQMPPPSFDIDMSGSETTALELDKLLTHTDKKIMDENGRTAIDT